MPLQSAPLRSLGFWLLGLGRWHYPAARGQGELEEKESQVKISFHKEKKFVDFFALDRHIRTYYLHTVPRRALLQLTIRQDKNVALTA